jgi:hypothetical protein
VSQKIHLASTLRLSIQPLRYSIIPIRAHSRHFCTIDGASPRKSSLPSKLPLDTSSELSEQTTGRRYSARSRSRAVTTCTPASEPFCAFSGTSSSDTRAALSFYAAVLDHHRYHRSISVREENLASGARITKFAITSRLQIGTSLRSRSLQTCLPLLRPCHPPPGGRPTYSPTSRRSSPSAPAQRLKSPPKS